jgi:hypothetical protein
MQEPDGDEAIQANIIMQCLVQNLLKGVGQSVEASPR